MTHGFPMQELSGLSPPYSIKRRAAGNVFDIPHKHMQIGCCQAKHSLQLLWERWCQGLCFFSTVCSVLNGARG